MDTAKLEPILAKHNLVAFITNESWVLIRRRDYIDVFIKDQPYNSVQVLFHVLTKVSDCVSIYFVTCSNYFFVSFQTNKKKRHIT